MKSQPTNGGLWAHGPKATTPLVSLGTWPVTDEGNLCGIAMGHLAFPVKPQSKEKIDTLYFHVPEQMVVQTIIHTGDENAVVDFTYGNRERLRTYLLCQMHQHPSKKPDRHHHSFIVTEELHGNSFFIRICVIDDSIIQAIETFLDGKSVVFVLNETGDKSLHLYLERPIGKELLKISWADLLKSPSLHERVTGKKIDRREYLGAKEALKRMQDAQASDRQQ